MNRRHILLLGASFLTGALIAVAMSLASRTRATDEDPPTAKTRVALNINPYADAFFRVWVHSKAIDEPIPAGLEGAVAGAREIDRRMGFLLPWERLFIPSLSQLSSFEPLMQRCEEISPVVQTSTGEVKLQELYGDVVRGLVAGERVFMNNSWVHTEADLLQRKRELDAMLQSNGNRMISHVLADLDLTDPAAELPCLLLSRAPFVGGITLQYESGEIVSYVECLNASSVETLGIVLHEAIHSLDLVARQRGTATASVLDRLRAVVQGKPEGGEAVRHMELAIHGVIDGEATWMVRRYVDDAYDRQDAADFPAPALAARKAWMEHLAGKTSLKETLEEIVVAATPSSQ